MLSDDEMTWDEGERLEEQADRKRQDELLTVGETAIVLKRPEKTVRYLIRHGRLPAVKVSGGGIRVVRRDAETYRAKHRGKPPSDEMPVGALDIQETADRLKYHREYVRKLALRGVIPGYKTAVKGRWYFFWDEVEASFREAS